MNELAVDDLLEKIRVYRSSQICIGGSDRSELVPVDEIERRYVGHVLETVVDNKTLASPMPGLDRTTLCRKLKAHGVVSDQLHFFGAPQRSIGGLTSG